MSHRVDRETGTGRRAGGAWALATTLLWAAAAGSEPLPAPTDPAWQPLEFRNVETPTRYAAADDAPGVLEAEARCAASARVLPLENVDLDATPILRWRWRVLRGLAGSDERTKAGDDFAARIYVMFRFEPEKASLFERARRRLGESLVGTEMPGAALSFVWTHAVAPGERWTSPYTAESKILALARGGAGVWREESIDVIAAYREAFGGEPAEPMALGVMTDADNGCQHAVAQYADFRLDPRPTE